MEVMPRRADSQADTPRAQEARWRFLIESCADLITTHKRNGVYVYVSPSSRQMLGYEPDELAGHKPLEFVHEDDKHTVQSGLSHVLQKPNASHTITYRMRTKRGNHIWVETRSNVVQHGTPEEEVVCISRDISRRKLSEEHEHEQQKRLFSMTHSPKALMWLSDMQGRRIYFNSTWLHYTGRGLRDEYGLGWMAGLHGRDKSRYSDAFSQHARELRPYEHEYRLRNRRGEYRWIRELAVPRFAEDAVFEGYTGSCFDITDMKEAHNKLRKQKEELGRLKFALDHFADHVVITDSNGLIIYANRAAVEMTGFPLEEMLGKRHGGPDLWGGNMTPDFYQDLWRQVKQEKQVYSGYLLNRKKTGEFYGAYLRVHPLTTQAGRLRYFAAFEREVPIERVEPRHIISPHQETLLDHKTGRAKAVRTRRGKK